MKKKPLPQLKPKELDSNMRNKSVFVSKKRLID